MEREHARCSECGTDPLDWLAADGRSEALPPLYEVETRLCFGCKALARVRRERDEVRKAEESDGRADDGVRLVFVVPDTSTYHTFDERLVKD